MERSVPKKLLIIKGSCRENGFTNRLIQTAASNLHGTDISVFDPYTHKFAYCNGCGYCDENGACIHRDLDGFFEEFENCDVIVFVSPVYNGGFPAPVKALIDRFQFYYNKFYKNGKAQPVAKRRKVLLLSAAGRQAQEEFSYMEKVLKRAFTVLNGEYAGGICCRFTDTSPDFDEALNEFEALLKRSLTNE